MEPSSLYIAIFSVIMVYPASSITFANVRLVFPYLSGYN
jgi:hypothetical protein